MDNEKIEKKFLFDLNMERFNKFPTSALLVYSFRGNRNLLKLIALLKKNDFKEEWIKGINYTIKDLRNYNRRYMINVFLESKKYSIGECSQYLSTLCNEIPNYIKRYDLNEKEDEND